MHLAHMLLNAAVIATVGAAIERRTSAAVMLFVGLFGGTVGAWASAVADPGGFVSGASQASLALCGAAAILLGKRSAGWWIALAATMIAIALDVRTSGTLKAGHVTGFAVSLVCGLPFAQRRRADL